MTTSTADYVMIVSHESIQISASQINNLAIAYSGGILLRGNIK